jgi:hypothetical protein
MFAFHLGVAPRAVALEARIAELRIAGGTLRAALEIRDMFPAKFQSVLEQRGAIYLRVQIELWEHRLVWDKLVQPAVVSVFRIVLEPSTRQVSVADRYGEVSRQPAWQEPLVLRLELARGEAIADETRYYARAQTTLGTIAEREEAAEGVFGTDEGSVTLGSVGRVLFHAVLQVNDYLQSVSATVRTRDITGRELRAGVRP